MKKFAKMSLIAAIAVAGTTASAQPLAEAIKNVEISGSVVYRYDDYADGSGDVTRNKYKLATSLKSKVTDDVTFNARIMAGGEFNNEASLETNTADTNLDVELSEANFTYTGLANTTVTLGKQGVATAFTVARDSLGAESTGTGILATYTFAPVTVAAAYFNQTNITEGVTGTALNGTDVAVVAILGSFAGINADAWYLDANDLADAYTVGLSGTFDLGAVSLSPSIRYSEMGTDSNADNDDYSIFKAEIAASMGMFNAYVGYGESGKEGGVAIDGNSSDTVVDPHWNVALITQADAEIIYAGIGAQVTDSVNISLKHTDLDNSGITADEKETYAQVAYDHSKNLSTYVRVGQYEVDGLDDSTVGRLQVAYSF